MVEPVLVRNTAGADVAKIVVYVVACFLLAALFSPALYQIGKGFGEAASTRDTAGFVDWLGGKARKADFPTYFKRALMVCAVVLLVPLIYSLRLKVDPRKLQDSRWSIYLPASIRDQNVGQPLIKNHSWWVHLFFGFLLAVGTLFLMAMVLFHFGWFYFDGEPEAAKVGDAIKRALAPTVITATIEEVLFRGALLGIFLRAFRVPVAILLLSLLFAALHFLQAPGDAVVSRPGSLSSGFEVLGLIGARFLQPQTMLYEFASLLLVGLILAHARYGTASLWLPIGLHAGWIFAFKIFKKLTVRDPELPKQYDVFIGESIVQGVLPLVTLLLTWLILWPFIKHTKEPSR